jgi:hypothetical protein
MTSEQDHAEHAARLLREQTGFEFTARDGLVTLTPRLAFELAAMFIAARHGGLVRVDRADTWWPPFDDGFERWLETLSDDGPSDDDDDSGAHA